MKKIIYTISALVLIVLFMNVVLAVDPVDIGARVKEAQGALNVESFDAGKAVGTDFSDSINPYTGALSITLTDVVVPGRNGMDIILTRSYSSNIFASINHFGSGGYQSCDLNNPKGINHIVCDVNGVDDCLLPLTLPYGGNLPNFRVWDSFYGEFSTSAGGTRNMHRCDYEGYDS